MHYITLKEFPFKFKIKQRSSSIEFFQTHVYIFYLLDEVLLRNFHHPVQFKAGSRNEQAECAIKIAIKLITEFANALEKLIISSFIIV